MCKWHYSLGVSRKAWQGRDITHRMTREYSSRKTRSASLTVVTSVLLAQYTCYLGMPRKQLACISSLFRLGYTSNYPIFTTYFHRLPSHELVHQQIKEGHDSYVTSSLYVRSSLPTFLHAVISWQCQYIMLILNISFWNNLEPLRLPLYTGDWLGL